MSRNAVLALLAAGALVSGACGDSGQPNAGTDRGAKDATTPTDQEGRGRGALGGGAQTETLARRADVRVPEGKVAWVAREVRLEPGQELRHEHPFSTVYAQKGIHRLETPDGSTELPAGKGAAVAAGSVHTHAATSGRPSVFWDVLLAEPGAELPKARQAELIFESEPLDGVPENPTLAFIKVTLPPGTQTSVHTHPGPEFIFGIEGNFAYQNAIEGIRENFGPGDKAGIPPETAVQKRATGETASFLSWFLVDQNRPFAPPAKFSEGSSSSGG